MTKRTYVAVLLGMVAAATAVRVHNALTFSPLRGYDAFGHFTYVWYVSETWQVPLSTAGWSFFHPPLYYAVMAAVWKGLAGVDPLLRLRLGALLMSVLSLTHAAVGYVVVRRAFPDDRLLHVLAAGLLLFIPVHLYSAPFLGNEGLGAVFCSISILTLLSLMARPSLIRAAALGLWLGLAMLTKFSALAIVLGAFGSLALQALAKRTFGAHALALAVLTAVMLAVCGWYYARNVQLYGTPFKLSRDEFMVRHVENLRMTGARTLGDYLTFDPLIFVRPRWPRDVPWIRDQGAPVARSAIRESVWTGVYANAWFDGFGGWVVPPISESGRALRAGQALLALGLVPTLLVLLGIGVALADVRRRGWDDTLVPMLLTFTAMIGIFIHGTRAAPPDVAVKATYFTPVAVVFSFWFALGLKRLAERRRTCLGWVAAACAALALGSVAVFWDGLLWVYPRAEGRVQPYWTNQLGVVYYAGGNRAKARALFASAALRGSHLGYENLASLALEDGRPQEALRLLVKAARLQPRQSFGTPADRRYFDRLTQAEYSNTMAVIYHALGRPAEALRAAEAAAGQDPSMPEAHYNVGVLALLDAGGGDAPGGAALGPDGAAALQHAIAHLSRAADLDPGFLPASALLGVAQALAGDCAGAARTIRGALSPPRGLRREFPAETGRGIAHAAAIGRRKYIDRLPRQLEPAFQLERCEGRET